MNRIANLGGNSLPSLTLQQNDSFQPHNKNDSPQYLIQQSPDYYYKGSVARIPNKKSLVDQYREKSEKWQRDANKYDGIASRMLNSPYRQRELHDLNRDHSYGGATRYTNTNKKEILHRSETQNTLQQKSQSVILNQAKFIPSIQQSPLHVSSMQRLYTAEKHQTDNLQSQNYQAQPEVNYLQHNLSTTKLSNYDTPQFQTPIKENPYATEIKQENIFKAVISEDQAFLSRPMNDFMDVQVDLLLKQEQNKKQLAQDLRAQIEEKNKLKQQAKEKELKEILEIENRYQKDLQLMKEQQARDAENNKRKERALKQQNSLQTVENKKSKVVPKLNLNEVSLSKELKIPRTDTPVTIISQKSLKRSVGVQTPIKNVPQTKSFFITQEDIISQATPHPSQPILNEVKSELSSLKQAIENTQNQLQLQVDRVLFEQQKADEVKSKKFQEIKLLQQQIQTNKIQYQDKEWEQISRALHWRNSLDELETLSPTKETIKLKQILTHDYVQGLPNQRKYSQITLHPIANEIQKKRQSQTVLQSDHGTLNSSSMYNMHEIRQKNLSRLSRLNTEMSQPSPVRSLNPIQQTSAFGTIENGSSLQSIDNELFKLLERQKKYSHAVNDSNQTFIMDQLY